MLKGITRVLFSAGSDADNKQKPKLEANMRENGHSNHDTRVDHRHDNENFSDHEKKKHEPTGTKKIMRSERAGLCFSVGRVENRMRQVPKGEFRISGEAPVVMTAIIEKVLVDVLKLSVEECRKEKLHRITANHVHHAIQSSGDSGDNHKELFSHLNFANISIDVEREREDFPELPIPKSERSQLKRCNQTTTSTIASSRKNKKKKNPCATIRRAALSIKSKPIQKKKKKNTRRRVVKPMREPEPEPIEEESSDEEKEEENSSGEEPMVKDMNVNTSDASYPQKYEEEEEDDEEDNNDYYDDDNENDAMEPEDNDDDNDDDDAFGDYSDDDEVV